MKHIILCIAGQSNAVGYDESIIYKDYLKSFKYDRLFQLGLYEDDNLNVIPLKESVHSFQDMRPFSNPNNYKPALGCKGIHLPLCNLLLQIIPEDYNILVVPCAYGGTGFLSSKTGSYDKDNLKPNNCMYWGIDSPLYKAMKDRIEYVLNLNEENLFLGTIWIQGENDFENPDLHFELFNEMVNDFINYFKQKYSSRVLNGNWDRNIWYNVETVDYWYKKEGCQKIWKNYKTWNINSYIPIPRKTSSNIFNGTKITSSIPECHYGNSAFIEVVAPEVFKVISRRFV